MSLIRFRLAQLFPVAGLITLLAFTGCASSTVLQSQPTGAHVFLNNVPVGTTPYTMTDQNIVGTTTQVRLEYPGYQPLNTYIIRNEELDPLALIGGLLVLVPLLWIMKYTDVHYYQLQPAAAGAPPAWGRPRIRAAIRHRRASRQRPRRVHTRPAPPVIPRRRPATRRRPASRPSRGYSAAASVSALVSGVPALMRIGSRPPLCGLLASAQA